MRLFILSVMLLAVMALAACAPGSPASFPSTPSDVEASTYGDPFAYCAAVGTVNTPDARYDGASMPDAIIDGMLQEGIVAADAPREFQENAVWRCMDGQVWVCHFGANLPCVEQADTSQEPSAAMQEYCVENPATDFIPAAVTGRATVYAWRCADGAPEAGEQVLQPDPQGFLGEFWHRLDTQS